MAFFEACLLNIDFDVFHLVIQYSHAMCDTWQTCSEIVKKILRKDVERNINVPEGVWTSNYVKDVS